MRTTLLYAVLSASTLVASLSLAPCRVEDRAAAPDVNEDALALGARASGGTSNTGGLSKRRIQCLPHTDVRPGSAVYTVEQVANKLVQAKVVV